MLKVGGTAVFKRSIRNKLIVLLLLITTIPFGSSVLITHYYTKEALTEKAIEDNANLLYQGKINMEGFLKEINNFSLSIYNNTDFMHYLKTSRHGTDFATRDTVNSVLLTLLYANESIKRVSISNVESNRLITVSTKSNVVHSINNKDFKIDSYLKAKSSPHNLYIEPVYDASSERNTINSFILHRSIVNVPAQNILAFMSLTIDSSKVSELSKRLYDEETEEFYILTPEGKFIYSSEDSGSVSTDSQPAWVKQVLKAEQENGIIEWHDDHFEGTMVYDRVSESLGNWILVKRLPNAFLHQKAYGIGLINIVFGLIGLTLVILATLFVSFKITSPIRILVQNIKQIEKGNFKVQFKSLGNDEIGILGERFKQMIERINLLINREYKLEIENKTNQLKVLQSQINPHFLYNALQSIGTLALKSNAPKVYSLLTQLGKIMRYGMEMEENKVTLDKEVNYIKAYLLLHKERFDEQFSYSLDFEKEILSVKVPKMILQPLIENYFKHGFDPSDENTGQLWIEGKREQDELVICIMDNGRGMTQERINQIERSFIELNNSKETSIGLRNVYFRLKLNYAEHASMKLLKRESGGLMVLIRLPIRTEGECYESDNNR